MDWSASSRVARTLTKPPPREPQIEILVRFFFFCRVRSSSPEMHTTCSQHTTWHNKLLKPHNKRTCPLPCSCRLTHVHMHVVRLMLRVPIKCSFMHACSHVHAVHTYKTTPAHATRVCPLPNARRCMIIILFFTRTSQSRTLACYRRLSPSTSNSSYQRRTCRWRTRCAA
jgi:hypothetical protein